MSKRKRSTSSRKKDAPAPRTENTTSASGAAPADRVSTTADPASENPVGSLSASNVHQASISDATRTFVSLLLFIHLFCVVVVLSGNFMPSQLQADLANTVGIYTKTLHLDPNFVPFHFTDGEQAMTRLHQWQLLESESADASDGEYSIAYRLPSDATVGGFNHQRQDMLARVAGFYAANEALDDEVAAAMAKSIAAHVHATGKLKSKRWLVRCVKYVADGDIQTEAVESDGISVLYEANVWISNSGEASLLKRIEPRRTAPVKPTDHSSEDSAKQGDA